MGTRSVAGKAPATDPLGRLDALGVWPYPRRVLAVVGAAYFFAFSDIVNIGFALPVIAEQFSVSTTTVAIAITAGLVGYVIGALADSVVGDRYGRRIGLVVSIAAFSVGTVIAAAAPNLGWLIAGRFIAGMGIGAEIASAAAYLAGISPTRLRGRAGTVAVSWGFAGLAATPFLALALVPHFDVGWRVLFLVSVAGGLATFGFRRHLPESPRWLVARGDVDSASRVVDDAVRFARQRGGTELAAPEEPARSPMGFGAAVALFFTMWFVYYVGNYAWLTLAPTLLTKEGFSLTSSIAFLSVTGLGLVAGALSAVRLAERFQRRRTVATALVVFALALLGIGLVPEPVVIMVLGFIVSGTIGVVVPLAYVLTAEHFDSLHRARGVAITDGVGHLGGALAPYVVLPVAGIGFVWGMAAMAATGLVAAAVVLAARDLTGRSIS